MNWNERRRNNKLATGDNEPEKMQMVFVYGTLLKGMPNDYYLEGSTLIGQAITTEEFQLQIAMYIPFMKRVGAEEKNKTNVVGELYEVDSWTLNLLDGLEGYDPDYDGGPYKRVKIECMLTETGQLFDAWAYITEKTIARFVLNSGDYRHFSANMATNDYTQFVEDLAERCSEDEPCPFPELVDADDLEVWGDEDDA